MCVYIAAPAAAAAGIQQCTAARAVPQRCCVGRHLANRNELRVSGSDSYALLYLCAFFINTFSTLSHIYAHKLTRNQPANGFNNHIGCDENAGPEMEEGKMEDQ